MMVHVVYRVYNECDEGSCPGCDIPLAAFSSEDKALEFRRAELQSARGRFEVEVEPLELDAEVKESKR